MGDPKYALIGREFLEKIIKAMSQSKEAIVAAFREEQTQEGMEFAEYVVGKIDEIERELIRTGWFKGGES